MEFVWNLVVGKRSDILYPPLRQSEPPFFFCLVPGRSFFVRLLLVIFQSIAQQVYSYASRRGMGLSSCMHQATRNASIRRL
jgi:hypothetical protein